MKSKRESANKSEANHKQEKEIAEAADFDSKRMHQMKKIEIKRESANKPEGNYDYEQMVAEDACFNTQTMIEEAAYFIAKRRGFAPGNEMSDWLQAEAEVHGVLQSTVIERRKGGNDARLDGGASLRK